MMKNIFKSIFFTASLFIFSGQQALAQANLGVNDLAGSGLGTNDVVGIVNNLINIFLGFLTIIAVIVIIYAGWLWMTSQGDADKIQRAKLMIVSAVIGLVVILSSYLIARYVIRTLSDATGGGNNNGNEEEGPGPGPLPACGEPLDSTEIAVCRTRPNSGVPGQYITIQGWHFGSYNPADSQVFFETSSGTRTQATLASCSGVPVWRESNTPGYFNIRAVIPAVDQGDYKIIVKNGPYEDAYPDGLDYYSVTTGEAGPGIACIIPEDPSPGENITIEGNNFGNTPSTITMSGWVAGSEQDINFLNIGSWSNTLITAAQVPNNALASDLFVSVSGINSNDYYLAVSCADDGQCESGCCADNVCRPDSWCTGGGGGSGPHIEYLTPDTVAEGNLITIYGSGFGDSQGSGNVWFTDSSGSGRVAGRNPNVVNPSCSNTWHDDYIVVVVPADVLDNNADVWVETNDGEESNQKNFHDNGGNLPGLCSLDTASGAYGQVISLSGINFNAGDKASYGGVLDSATTINSPTGAQSTVPNLAAGRVGLSVQTAAGDSGNALPFNIDPLAGGNPIINEVSPEQGPVGQYLTIIGANFGNSIGTVKFIDSTEHLADVDFPNQCSDNYWRNNQIIVKVPAGLESSSEIQVVRNDLATSNLYDFNLTAGNAGPGICLIEPNNGPVNLTPVNIYGDNFGSSGQVDYFNNVASGINTWSDQLISTRVPAGAITGPVTVTASGRVSNAVNFSVGSCSNDSQCSGGQTCCSSATGNYCAANCPGANICSYSWTVTTAAQAFGIWESYECSNDLQSPSPWPDGLWGNDSQEAYVDSQIIGLFTRNVVDADLLSNAITKVFKCTGRDLNCTTEVAGSLSIVNHNSQREGFQFDPAASLETDSWYQVQLGVYHAAEGGDVWDGTTYEWNFKTRAEGLMCQVSSITVSPNENFNVGQEKNFYASAVGDNCNVCGSNYTWSPWNVTYNGAYPNDKVTIVSQDTTGSSAQVRLRGLAATANNTPNYIEVMSTLGGFSDTVQSTITDSPLTIVDYGPNCGNACPNGAVWITFNTPLNPAVVNEALFTIKNCHENPDCTDSSPIAYEVNYDEENYRVWIENVDFEPSTWYLASVGAAIENVSGYSLQPPVNFEWTFKTGEGANCSVARVEVAPGSYLTNSTNPINYTAHPYSARNECRESGLPLDPADYNWIWTSSNSSIATVSGSASYQETVRPADEVEGTTVITAKESASSVSGIGNLEVDTIINDDSSEFDFPRVSAYFPTLSPVCTNTAVSVDFTEIMSRESVRSYFKLYYQEFDVAERTPECNDIWCPIESDLSFVENPGGTRSILNPRDNLDPNTRYLAIVNRQVSSVAGFNLDSADYNYNFDSSPGNDSFGWEFTTGANACDINFVTVEPAFNYYTRVDQSKEFVALAYDIAGNLLTADNYSWSENEGLVDLVNPVANAISAVANNQNGESTVTVVASGPGSAIGTTQVRVFLCENPWPNPYSPFLDEFPFDFRNEVHGFNFSTYYCQDSGREQSTILPYLTTEPIDQPGSQGLLREFIFVVDPQEVAFNYNNLAKKDKESWWSRLLNRFKASALAVANPPTNLDLISNAPNAIIIGWQDNSDNEDGFKIYRRSDITDWTEIAEIGANTEQYTDENIVSGQVYSYRVAAFIDYPSGPLLSAYTNSITVTAGASSLDLIGVQVRANPEHLSVMDWFNLYAPNPNENGRLFEIDGYEALQVGNTVYISAANLSGPNIFTNIYIISHNIGAREGTVEIFDQLVANFSFSANIFNAQVCSVSSEVSCSSDFDCPSGELCQANGDKLRRDTKRLTDLVSVQRRLRSYGQLYKACQNNTSISCQTDIDCPVGDSCIPYYPLLNSGTYLSGASVSLWPSWRQEFSSQLFNTPLPIDPLNRFNGDCPEGYNQATCWNAEESLFSCPANSFIYVYQNSNGYNYNLSANFESGYFTDYNLISPPPVNLPSNGISFNNDYMCSGNPIGNNAIPLREYCGDGQINLLEECDINSFRNLCDAILGDQDWWNERTGGCYPPGRVDSSGNSIQCTWYEPAIPLTNAICGGYCGDSSIQTNHEACEGNGVVPGYSCVDGSTPVCNGCQPICSGDGSIAIRCGDGYWDQAHGEECDASANPNGLTGVSCTVETGILSCNSCHYSCTLGEPYFGSCGNNEIEGDEQCEPALYSSPEPADSDATHQYECSDQCRIAGGYCGDRITNRPYESCDTNGWITPSPAMSSATYQYVCDTCVNRGGWCGDRIVHNGEGGRLDWGEACEDGDRVDNNVCNNACQWNCNDTNGDSIPDSGAVEHQFIFNGYTPEVVLHDGESAVMNLPACRLRGDVEVDITIDNGAGAYDTGVLFVSDVSGSMAGAPLDALKTAIAGTGNALDTIFSTNPMVRVGLISYNDTATANPASFYPTALKNLLKNRVNAYVAGGGTNHVAALQLAAEKFALEPYDFEHEIVILMTDGGTASAAAIAQAQTLKNNGIDIFTITLNDDNGLLTFMNGMSSSNCTCSGSNCNLSSGSCGDGSTYCASGNFSRFEECDGQAGCNAQCQWSNQFQKRAYQADSASDLTSMYQYIVQSLAPGDITLSYNSTNLPIEDTDGDNIISGFVLPAASLMSPASCLEGEEHNINITLDITGNPNASVTISNPVFNFCPWENGSFY